MMIKLSEEVGRKYVLTLKTGGDIQLFGKFGKIQFSKMSIEQADNLYKKGFRWLRLKKVEKPASSASSKSSGSGSQK